MKYMKKSTKEIKLEKLKSELSQFEFLAPGRLRKTLMKCGNKTCACQKDPKDRHGPYHLWDRKVKNKLTSKMVTRQQAEEIAKWINQRKKVEKVLEEVIRLSQDLILDRMNSKKR